MRLEVVPDAEAAAARAASEAAARCRAAVADRGGFTFAVSGGRTPWAMMRALAEFDLPWDRVAIYQVDERVAPAGDPDRNLTLLIDAVPPALGALHPMPVERDDLEAAAAAYAAELPERFDLVHLGLGDDGHTASLVPGDPVLEVRDRDVALTATYRGRRRMTVTFPVLDRAVAVLWLVTGAGKADALAALRAGDRAIPAARVAAADQVLVCDAAAANEPGPADPGRAEPP